MTNPELSNKPSRKELEKQQRRFDILMAAKTLFVQKGYHNTTLEEVAQLAEFGKGTIYNYFRNKEDLFYAILEHYTAEVLEITKRALQDTKGALKEKLRAFALSTVQYGRANEDVFHLLMREVNQPNSVF
ncbi:TetR/AcrR family transcriptional regulator, partial [bacterium]|nr:TetR/AcrR family transcriptional regulator [bacterium]